MLRVCCWLMINTGEILIGLSLNLTIPIGLRGGQSLILMVDTLACGVESRNVLE